MHKDAQPDVIVHMFRHPFSRTNATQRISSPATPLHPVGSQQVEYMVAMAIQEGATAIVTSTADRTWEPAIHLAKSHHGKNLTIIRSPLYDEWEKPALLHGKKRSDPELQGYLQNRIRNFGPDYAPCYEGEETYEQSVHIVEEGLRFFLHLGQTHKVIAHFGHRHRTLMLKTRALWGSLHPELFKKYYFNSGFDNGAMFRIWYGQKFAPEKGIAPEWDWCTDEGGNTHIPQHLRTS